VKCGNKRLWGFSLKAEEETNASRAEPDRRMPRDSRSETFHDATSLGKGDAVVCERKVKIGARSLC
jgi:hypothetical protein